MKANAEIILVREDGSLILQVRDNKPGITNPGLISTFGGHIEAGEEPIDAAVREINEETNLGLKKEQLQFYRKCRKTKEVHGEDWDVYYFVATPVSEKNLKVFEGEGYTIIRNAQELQDAKATILLKQVLTDYFDGFRSFMLLPDITDNEMQKMLESHYVEIINGKKPSDLRQPIALAVTGLVASGKSTVTTPLADIAGAVRISSDYIREMLFRAGYNFKEVRPFMARLMERLVSDKYNLFLDFNISTNIDVLDKLKGLNYRVYVIRANPPEEFIKEKILSGNMKHELTFFTKDAHVYESMLSWKDEHVANLPGLKEKYSVWHEVDTSRVDLKEVMKHMQDKFKHDFGSAPGK
ncbi:MAG TPA: NUDIX domain-containing protein [Candidatus Limnocylindrales bacterium]|nr:NUDIX domain-containing protein [Candidatus Limnocylindrales bacterium]